MRNRPYIGLHIFVEVLRKIHLYNIDGKPNIELNSSNQRVSWHGSKEFETKNSPFFACEPHLRLASSLIAAYSSGKNNFNHKDVAVKKANWLRTRIKKSLIKTYYGKPLL